ncbi:hypothetical protein ACFY1L_41960 [Streptomyces sp. NPDC001663]|uniref:protein kinase domain-containing protein n=1 Tax=Streptomyces sp. NPDC001663 TaxID=3364597 RepID=UPI00368D00D8
MPPERATGASPGPASDWWALGATLCAALTGHSPFARSSTPATLLAVVYEEPELPDADCPLTPLLGRLLAKDPEQRPGADEVVAELTSLVTAPEPLQPEEQPPRDRLSRLLTVLLLLAAAAVAAIMVITAIPPGGGTRLPDTTAPPTVAGTSRPPSSPAATTPSGR